jgi:hypothetical protein
MSEEEKMLLRNTVPDMSSPDEPQRSKLFSPAHSPLPKRATRTPRVSVVALSEAVQGLPAVRAQFAVEGAVAFDMKVGDRVRKPLTRGSYSGTSISEEDMQILLNNTANESPSPSTKTRLLSPSRAQRRTTEAKLLEELPDMVPNSSLDEGHLDHVLDRQPIAFQFDKAANGTQEPLQEYPTSPQGMHTGLFRVYNSRSADVQEDEDPDEDEEHDDDGFFNGQTDEEIMRRLEKEQQDLARS